MRDYRFTMDDGRTVPVSEMPKQDIIDILEVGDLQIDDSDGNVDDKQNILERLRIELLIRELNL